MKLSWILFASALLCKSSDAAFSQCGDDLCDVDVLILGCGMAGVTAAWQIEKLSDEYLLGAQPITWKIVESADFCGGRSRASHYVQGGEFTAQYEIIEKYNLPITEFDYSNAIYYSSTGDLFNQTVAEDLVKDAEAVFECLEETALLWFDDRGFEQCGGACPTSDPGLRVVLEDFCDLNDWASTSGPNGEFPYDPTSGNLKSALEFFYIEYETLKPPEDLSLYNLPPVNPQSGFNIRDDVFYLTDPANQALIVTTIIENELIDGYANIMLKSRVTKVLPFYDGKPSLWLNLDEEELVEYAQVTVEDTDTKETMNITAARVISTFSVGVNAEFGYDIYAEEEGEESTLGYKFDTMSRIFGMGVYVEIFFQFNEVFWTEAYLRFIETVTRGACNIWESYEDFYPASNILVCAIATDVFFDRATELSENEYELSTGAVMTLLRESLGKAYPDLFWITEDCSKGDPFAWTPEDSPPDEGCNYYTFPQFNENWMGSYEYWKPSDDKDVQFYEDYYIFRDTVPYWADNLIYGDETPVLIQGGTATCDSEWGFVNGAWLTGHRDGFFAFRSFFHPFISVEFYDQCTTEWHGGIVPVNSYGVSYDEVTEITCGGILLAPDIMLSRAIGCLGEISENGMYVGFLDENLQELTDVLLDIPIDSYDPIEETNDLLIVKLADSFPGAKLVQLSTVEPVEGVVVTAIGFEEFERFFLGRRTYTVMDKATCNSLWMASEGFMYDDDQWFCLEPADEEGCVEDFGSALFDEKGKLIGIEYDACVGDLPSVYTKVSNYATEIESLICQNTDSVVEFCPTPEPSSAPTSAPSLSPTGVPSASPSAAPSPAPSPAPTGAPSMSPTAPMVAPIFSIPIIGPVLLFISNAIGALFELLLNLWPF